MEVGVMENVKKQLAGSSLTWASHAEMMGDEKLTKRENNNTTTKCNLTLV